MEIDTFLDLSTGTFPIIIKPNIGQPTLINIKEDFTSSGKKKIIFSAMVVAMKSHSIERVLEQFHSNLFIQPILKDQGNFSERRGEKYPLRAIEIKQIDKIDLEDQPLLTEENCIAMDIYKTALNIKGIYGKRDALFEIIYEIPHPIVNNIIQILNKYNRKVILFDIVHDIPNMSESKLIREKLDDSGTSYQYLDGSTSTPKRKRAIDAFQRGEGEVFLISLKAGGFGLNLTAADYVIHMDPWWNPATEDQASDRAHRIGQTRPVTIYRFITRGTIEEKIVNLHHRKRELAESILSDTGDANAIISPDELLALIRE